MEFLERIQDRHDNICLCKNSYTNLCSHPSLSCIIDNTTSHNESNNYTINFIKPLERFRDNLGNSVIISGIFVEYNADLTYGIEVATITLNVSLIDPFGKKCIVPELNYCSESCVFNHVIDIFNEIIRISQYIE